MSNTPVSMRSASTPSRRGVYIFAAVAVVVLAAMVFDTKVVSIGGENDVRKAAFSADAYGEEQFPRIRAFVNEHAVDALTLGPEVLADKAGASKKYGTASSTGAIMMVKATGTIGDGTSGIYDLAVEGLPPDIRVRVQTGPAVNGTDLRDAPGDIEFGKFTNQIEYQNAGAGINRAMKKAVLDGVDAAGMKGKSAEVVGAFRLINPKNWLITPVVLVVK